jgi:hypothetical protein
MKPILLRTILAVSVTLTSCSDDVSKPTDAAIPPQKMVDMAPPECSYEPATRRTSGCASSVPICYQGRCVQCTGIGLAPDCAAGFFCRDFKCVSRVIPPPGYDPSKCGGTGEQCPMASCCGGNSGTICCKPPFCGGSCAGSPCCH